MERSYCLLRLVWRLGCGCAGSEQVLKKRIELHLEHPSRDAKQTVAFMSLTFREEFRAGGMIPGSHQTVSMGHGA